MAPNSAAAIAEVALARPAIMEATALLRISDSHLSRLLGVRPASVSIWGSRRGAMPPARQLCLIYVVARLAGLFDQIAGDHIVVRRARLLKDVLVRYLDLAAEELGEASPELRQKADCMAYDVLRKLGCRRELPYDPLLDEWLAAEQEQAA
jgi:hypothetical protein